MFFLLAWRNVWRNRRRSLITISAIAVGMAGIIIMIAMMDGMLINMIDNSVRLETGSIQVHAKGYHDDPTVEKLIRDPSTMLKGLKKVKGLTGISERIQSFGLVSADDNSTGAMIIGIEPQKEKDVTDLYRNVREGSYASLNKPNTVLIGKILAGNLGVGLGDEIILLTQGADGSMGNDIYTVGGIFASASPDMDRTFIFMNLESAEYLLSTYGGINEIAIAVKDVNNVDNMAKDVRAAVGNGKLEVLTWKQVIPGMAQMVVFFEGAIYLFYFIVFGIAAFGISNTLIMSIFERIHEIGVLLSVGTKPARIFWQIVTESIIMGLLGSIAGSVLGLLLSLYFMFFGLNLGWFAQIKTVIAMSPIIYFSLSPLDFVEGIIFVVFITGLASLYPAVRAARYKPAEALRYLK